MKKVIVLILLSSSFGFAQTMKQDSIWAPLKYFVGTWRGEGGGEPGIGKYERSYQFILNNNFIEIRNKSSYPPTAKNTKGEVHEDLGYIVYDKKQRNFLLRQFHIEGFVVDYKLESISPDKQTLVFIADDIVNIPKGWRAKETYKILKNNEFEETFELAEEGKEFSVYSKVKLIRQ